MPPLSSLRWALALASLSLVAVIALAALGWPAAKYVDNDFAGFWLGSRALLDGVDPYDVRTWAALHERIGSKGLEVVPPRTGFGYPLTTALVFAPIALFPIALAAPIWLVTQIAAALVALGAIGRRLFAPTLRRDLPVLVAFAAASQPAWVLAEGGNIGGFLLAIAAASAALLLADRPFAAGAVAALLVVKPHPLLVAIPLLLLALPRDRAVRMAAGGASVALPLVIATLAIRPGWIGEWLTPLGRISTAPVGRATLFGLLPLDVRPFGWIAVAGIVIAFAFWSRGRSLPIVIGAAIPLAIFCAPYGWSYDHTVLFVTAAVVIGLVANVPASLRARVLALLALVTVPLPWVLYVTAFSRGEESWSVATPLAVLASLAISARAAARAYGTMRS